MVECDGQLRLMLLWRLLIVLLLLPLMIIMMMIGQLHMHNI